MQYKMEWICRCKNRAGKDVFLACSVFVLLTVLFVEYQVFIYNLHRPAADVIHPANPFHLIFRL